MDDININNKKQNKSDNLQENRLDEIIKIENDKIVIDIAPLSHFMSDKSTTYNFSAYDYEDFLFEFSELVESLRFITASIAETNELDLENLAPTLRILTNNFIECYNHFSQIGSILFLSCFTLIESETKKLDSALSKYI